MCSSDLFDVLVAAASRGRIPVFSVIPPNAKKGALFDIGANYHEIGRMLGDLAADVLEGKDPASVPVENRMPKTLMLNRKTLASLKGTWSFPEDLVQRADLVIEADGTIREKAAASSAGRAAPSQATPTAPLAKRARIDLVE